MRTQLTLRYTGFDEDTASAGYSLGNGYRLYLPALMRFAAADESSPFERGGMNPYAYCGADPIGGRDPSGHFFLPAGLAIGAIAAIALKAAGSKLTRRFRGPVRAWIDEVNEDAPIDALNAAQAARHAPSAPLSSAAGATGSERFAWRRDQPAGGTRNAGASRASALHARRRERVEAEAIEGLDRAATALTVARKRWESARLLHLAADSSSEAAIVRQMASDEDAAGRAELDATASLVERMQRMRNRLSFELTIRFDSVQAEYETLQFDFYGAPDANGASDQRSPARIVTHL